jgi:hypothetical protein
MAFAAAEESLPNPFWVPEHECQSEQEAHFSLRRLQDIVLPGHSREPTTPLAYKTMPSPLARAVTSPSRLSSPLQRTVSLSAQFDSSDSDASSDDYDSTPKKPFSTPTKRMSTPRKTDCTPTPSVSTPTSFVSTPMQSSWSPSQFLSSPSHVVRQIHIPSIQENDGDISDNSVSLFKVICIVAFQSCSRIFFRPPYIFCGQTPSAFADKFSTAHQRRNSWMFYITLKQSATVS